MLWLVDLETLTGGVQVTTLCRTSVSSVKDAQGKNTNDPQEVAQCYASEWEQELANEDEAGFGKETQAVQVLRETHMGVAGGWASLDLDATSIHRACPSFELKKRRLVWTSTPSEKLACYQTTRSLPCLYHQTMWYWQSLCKKTFSCLHTTYRLELQSDRLRLSCDQQYLSTLLLPLFLSLRCVFFLLFTVPALHKSRLHITPPANRDLHVHVFEFHTAYRIAGGCDDG